MIGKIEIPKISDKKQRILFLLDMKNFQAKADRLLEMARERLVQSTPRSDGGGKHLADGWTKKIIGGSSKDRIPFIGIVYNKYTHTPSGKIRQSARIKTKSGGIKDYTLLEILEYGAAPHMIFPVTGDKLRFEVNGTVIFSRRVSHPGIAPKGMVRITQAWFAQAANKLTKSLARDYEKSFGSK